MVTVFRELRSGVTEDGRTKLKSPSGTLSTAEAISVVTSGLALAAHFGDGALRAADVAAGIVGAVVKDPVADRRGLDRVPRGGRPRARRLARLLPRLPGRELGAMTAGRGLRHPAPRPGLGPRRCVARARRTCDPDAVLIEGPPEADPLVALGAADGMEPPVALLAYAADDPSAAAFWPFAVFSPEWQAMRWALAAPGVARRRLPATCPRRRTASVGRRAAERRRAVRRTPATRSRPLGRGAPGTTTPSAGGRTSSSRALGRRVAVRRRSPRRWPRSARTDRGRAAPTRTRCCARRTCGRCSAPR